jgi:hypothetical protein
MGFKNKRTMILLSWNGLQVQKLFRFLVILMVGIEMNFGRKKMNLDAFVLH